jgi:hypothetical protein
MLDLRRREFITLLGGAAAAWPLVRHDQCSRSRILRVMSSPVSDSRTMNRWPFRTMSARSSSERWSLSPYCTGDDQRIS